MRRMRIVTGAALLLIAPALAACQTTSGGGADAITTGSTTPAPTLKGAAAAERDWRRDPKNLRKGLAYAASLRALGQTGRELAVLKALVGFRPRDVTLRAHYGRRLLAAGRAVQAEKAFRAVIALGRADWKAYNALGAALAAQGRYAAARAVYQQALKASPNNPKVLNNIAMSHILEGNPQQGERILRAAMKLPGGGNDPRLRQNLALALGLQGRFREARYIASQDLSPAEVEANMAYLKRMLGGSDVWKKLQKG